jgi:hypothetical protein
MADRAFLSPSGMVVMEAGTHPDVSSLVYVAARAYRLLNPLSFVAFKMCRLPLG